MKTQQIKSYIKKIKNSNGLDISNYFIEKDFIDFLDKLIKYLKQIAQEFISECRS